MHPRVPLRWPTSNTRQHFSNALRDEFHLLEIKEFGQDYARLERKPYRLGGAKRNADLSLRSNPDAATQRSN